MADNTHIEWTDATWNPITGCSVVSPGCTNCYAMKLAGTRLKHIPSRVGLTVDSKAGPVWNGKVRLNREWLDQPLRWKRPRKIFVCAHGDLFAENVPDEWIDRVFAVMALAPQHTFQVLTKRAKRMQEYCSTIQKNGRWLQMEQVALDLGFEPRGRDNDGFDWISNKQFLPNVWLGVSAEDQQRADERIPQLLATPAAIRFVSAEPLLRPIDFRKLWKTTSECWDAIGGEIWRAGAGSIDSETWRDAAKLDWIIVGGESGKGARSMHPDWARSIRDQCATADVLFFFKQWGEHAPRYDAVGREYVLRVGKKAAGRLLDGIEHNGMPETREVPFQ